MKEISRYYIKADDNIRGLDKNGFPKNDFLKGGELIFIFGETFDYNAIMMTITIRYINICFIWIRILV